MKNTLILLFLTIFISKTYSQTYTEALNKVNDYLKTFDNGYYGYLEISGDYLYDYYQSGKYCKANIYDLSEASVAEASRKVVINCKLASDCIYSTYTNTYHGELPFSATTDFNTSKLVNLLDDVLQAFKTKNGNTYSNSQRDKAANLRRNK